MKMKRLTLVNTILATVLLTSIFFMTVTSSSSSPSEYDPWLDTDDDGDIDFDDIVAMAMIYGTSGTPINKTALLLDLQSRVEELEAKFPVATGDIADSAVTDEKLAPSAIGFWATDTDATFEDGELFKWVPISFMRVDITLKRRSHLIITFSASMKNPHSDGDIWIQARVGGDPANPSSGLAVPKAVIEESGYTSQNFYCWNVLPGDYQVEIGWILLGGRGYAYTRSLTVIALPA